LQIIIFKKIDNLFPLFFFFPFFPLPFFLSVSFFSFFFHPPPPIPRFNLCKAWAQVKAEIKPDTAPRSPPCSLSQTRRSSASSLSLTVVAATVARGRSDLGARQASAGWVAHGEGSVGRGPVSTSTRRAQAGAALAPMNVVA
jgi:hypothetical protein